MAEDRRALIALIEHRDGSLSSTTWSPLTPEQIADATAALGTPAWHRHTPADAVRELAPKAAQAAVVIKVEGEPT